jgi:DNA repair ATPase RecN
MDNEVFHPNTMTPSVQFTYGLCLNSARYHSHLHANSVHHAMTQYSLNKGRRKFKEKVEKAMEKELKKLHMKDTFIPVDVGDLSTTQKKSALDSLMF